LLAGYPGVRHLHSAGVKIVARHVASLSIALALLSIATLSPVRAQEQSQLSASDYTQRGIACLRTDDFDGAIANFGKAIALNPDDAVNYFRRGVTYMERGVDRRNKDDLNRAVADLDKAIAIDPRNAVYYCHRSGRVKTLAFRRRL
jgi:tetratricopeptide (TPR) repeat protein